ncbi:hypothetical protein SADUNF_Sadunf13G0056200 [Salix dunnii]|uniref:COMM domain-containing protein n=1 Tax=Salix dunnii TaxID=1413687 RepID=A0A835JGM0_9ROSI|nr:hypothetical protein SADUNF_Sadunf13G0056200 [Salix dunnii]
MEDGDSLYLQLNKLSSVATKEEDVEHILTSLWKTRGTGLPSQLKSRFQSLLNLPSLSELDPVLACLRSIIRKCVHENLSSDDLLKLFPPDLSLDLQTTLITLLHKYQIQWKRDDLATTEQHSLPRTSVFRVNGPPSFTTEVPTQLWPRQDDANGRFNHNDLGESTSMITETAASFSVHHHVTPLDNMQKKCVQQKSDWRFFLEKQLSRRGKEWLYPLTLGLYGEKLKRERRGEFINTKSLSMIPRKLKHPVTRNEVRNNPLPSTDCTYASPAPNIFNLFRVDPVPANVPHLKSMTWTAENHNPSSASRVAIVTLKLQDYSKTSSGETEVKFQLSRDTVEAMLRSMTYIIEQLSSRVETTSGPAQKKQKQ